MGKAYQEGGNPFDDPAKVAALNSAGIVLFSRRTSSGSYNDNRKEWNELGNPGGLAGWLMTSARKM